MKVGAQAALTEQPSVGGIVLEHRVSAKGVEEVTIGGTKHRAFRLLDQVRIAGQWDAKYTTRVGDQQIDVQNELRHIWYVPDLGMAVRVRTQTVDGAPVAARSYEVTSIGTSSGS